MHRDPEDWISLRERAWRYASITLLVCGGIFILGCLLGSTGSVSGVEFSPDRISHRSFQYFAWCGIPVTPKVTREWRSPTDEFLHAHGFAPNADVANPRWHFVKGMAPGVRGWSGEAKPMCKAIGCWSRSDEWIKWSEANPELAQAVWPQVVEWARDRRYHEVQCLLEFTDLKQANSVEDVEASIADAVECAQH